ncbi:MAG: hypothetical protein KBC81_02590 [Candidatus Pacebacteria bacterium]|nr:hypothetical protein [Candidatus Paceibacterota bacterium]
MSWFAKKKELNPVTRNGIEAWLKSMVVRLWPDDRELAKKFQNAISELQKGNPAEAKLRIKSMCEAYDQAGKGLSTKQVAEHSLLRIWLEELG